MEPEEFYGDDDVTEEFEKPRHASGMVVSVRLGAEDAENLVTLAEESGRTVSQVARQAIRAYLSFSGRKVDTTEVTVASEGSLGLVIRLQGSSVATQVAAPIPSPYTVTYP
jgi:hypothetical protein